MSDTIETINDCGVASQGENIVLLMPRRTMDKETALRLAARILAVAGDDERFQKIYDAVRGT